jgi:hypothetical protein
MKTGCYMGPAHVGLPSMWNSSGRVEIVVIASDGESVGYGARMLPNMMPAIGAGWSWPSDECGDNSSS